MKRIVKEIYVSMLMFCLTVLLTVTCSVKADAAGITFKAYYDVAKRVVNEANARFGTEWVLDADLMDVGKQLAVDAASGNYEWNVQFPAREDQVGKLTMQKDSAKEWADDIRSSAKADGMDAFVEYLIGELEFFVQWNYNIKQIGILPMEFISGATEWDMPNYMSAIVYSSGNGRLNPVVKTGTHTETLYPGATKLKFDSGSNSCFAEKDTSGNTESTTKKVTSVKINGKSKTLLTGKSMQLTAVVSPSNAANKSVKWTTSNKKYATVSANGLVKARSAGVGKTVTITAKAQDGSGEKAAYKIKIHGAVKQIKLRASKNAVKVNKKVTIKATVTVGKGGSKALKWTSSNKKYATVNSKGVVTAKKAGKGKTVTITAKAKDGSGKKATIKIKIK